MDTINLDFFKFTNMTVPLPKTAPQGSTYTIKIPSGWIIDEMTVDAKSKESQIIFIYGESKK